MELQDSNELDENKEIHNERDKKKKHPIRRGEYCMRDMIIPV